MHLSKIAAGAGLQDMTPIELLAQIRNDRGVAMTNLTEGQLKLAEWLIDHPSSAVMQIGETLLLRILSGEAEPSDPLAVHIAGVTEGAVRPEHFAMRCQVVIGIDTGETDDLCAVEVCEAGSTTALSLAANDHAKVGEELDLIRRTEGLVLVAPGALIKLPFALAENLHSSLGLMLASGGANR